MTTTFVGALRLGGMTAPIVVDGPMNGEIFRAYAALKPRLQSDRDGLLQAHGLPEKAAARTLDALWRAMADALPRLTPQDCANFLKAAGYGPE